MWQFCSPSGQFWTESLAFIQTILTAPQLHLVWVTSTLGLPKGDTESWSSEDQYGGVRKNQRVHVTGESYTITSLVICYKLQRSHLSHTWKPENTLKLLSVIGSFHSFMPNIFYKWGLVYRLWLLWEDCLQLCLISGSVAHMHFMFHSYHGRTWLKADYYWIIHCVCSICVFSILYLMPSE